MRPSCGAYEPLGAVRVVCGSRGRRGASVVAGGRKGRPSRAAKMATLGAAVRRQGGRMRCYFMRGGRIEGVTFLKSGPDAALVEEAKSAFAQQVGQQFDGFEVW